VRLDYAGIVTFYDPALRSLVAARHGQPRTQHRLLNISTADANAKVAELEEVLQRSATRRSSGVDWASVTKIVIERYSTRLENFALTLASDADVVTKASAARAQVLTMLAPYITMADALPGTDGNNAGLAPIVQRCTTTQTGALPRALFTAQEQLLHDAVESTLHEICRRLARMYGAAFDVEEAEQPRAAAVAAFLEAETAELMGWLDWAVWVKCRPACAPNEMCTVPTWPFHPDEDPYDMTPRCARYPSVIN